MIDLAGTHCTVAKTAKPSGQLVVVIQSQACSGILTESANDGATFIESTVMYSCQLINSSGNFVAVVVIALELVGERVIKAARYSLEQDGIDI